MNNNKWMQFAIKKAREGIEKGQSPFGSCIIKNGEMVSCEHNVVWETTDITAHAEINAIRVACKKQNTIDLSGCTLYSTCEPCPMCFSASHWARIDKIVYGASITDAKNAGFHELTISCKTMADLGKSEIIIEKDVLKTECAFLFKEWSLLKGRSY